MYWVCEGRQPRSCCIPGLSIAFFALGLLGAWFFFWRKSAQNTVYGKPGTALAPLTRCLENLWYVDAFYTKVAFSTVHFCRHACGIFDTYVVDGFVNLQGYICRFLAWVVGIVDYEGVDGSVRGLGSSTLKLGRAARRVQSGNLQQYLYLSVFLAVGVMAISVWIIFAFVNGK